MLVEARPEHPTTMSAARHVAGLEQDGDGLHRPDRRARRRAPSKVPGEPSIKSNSQPLNSGWWNNQRLHGELDMRTPVEVETGYYADLESANPAPAGLGTP